VTDYHPEWSKILLGLQKNVNPRRDARILKQSIGFFREL
jgi:hypothetical protein